ncbi:hypothetical protein CPC08DRAFT_730097 [Agrocybe pediades]|nr:hypothetical protein CPC08DRAFT_730097 [Agrocybe pediades]
MRSAPGLPVPVPRAPTRKTPIVTPVSPPWTMTALDLFSTNEGRIDEWREGIWALGRRRGRPIVDKASSSVPDAAQTMKEEPRPKGLAKEDEAKDEEDKDMHLPEVSIPSTVDGPPSPTSPVAAKSSDKPSSSAASQERHKQVAFPRKMWEDMGLGAMGIPSGTMSAGGLPSASAGGASGLGSAGLVGLTGVGGSAGRGAVEDNVEEKGSEQEKDGVTKMEVKVKDAKDGSWGEGEGLTTPAMDAQIFEEAKPVREKFTPAKLTVVEHAKFPNP